MSHMSHKNGDLMRHSQDYLMGYVANFINR